MSDRTAVRASLLLSVVTLGTLVLLLIHRASSSEPPSIAIKSGPAPGDAGPAKAAAALGGGTQFWQTMQQTHAEADGDEGQQSGLIEDRLRRLSPQAIIAFDRERHRLDKRLYSWKIWAAATAIEDGCSDDCFRDFRAYLISLGPTAVEQALHDPDGLAPIAQDAENGDWENADNVAPEAYEGVTGNDYPLDDSDLSGAPTGPKINFDQATLRKLYPRLTARFRG
jgi:hypothetical protein